MNRRKFLHNVQNIRAKSETRCYPKRFRKAGLSGAALKLIDNLSQELSKIDSILGSGSTLNGCSGVLNDET